MTFHAVRRTLFTIHMWVGLILGILLAALGLSGSMLVYDQTIADMLVPPPRAVTAGTPLPLSMLAGIARDAAPALRQGPVQHGDAIRRRSSGVLDRGVFVEDSSPRLRLLTREHAAAERDAEHRSAHEQQTPPPSGHQQDLTRSG